MVLWWRMVQLELPLWSQSSTTSHTPIPWPVPRVTCPDWKGITTRQSSVRSRRRTRLYTDKAIYIRHNVLFSNEPIITGPPNGYTCGVRVRVQGQLDFMIVNCYTPPPPPPAMHQFRLADWAGRQRPLETSTPKTAAGSGITSPQHPHSPPK